MKVYAVHTIKVETQDLIDMLSRFPEAPIYGDLRLFPEVHPNPKQEVISLENLTLEDFAAAYAELTAKETHEGIWIHINKDQGMSVIDKYIVKEYAVVEEEVDG